MTRAALEALVGCEKETASSAAACLSFRPLYLATIVAKLYSARYINLKFHKFDGPKANTGEHIACFIDLMGPFPLMMNYVSENSQSRYQIPHIPGTSTLSQDLSMTRSTW